MRSNKFITDGRLQCISQKLKTPFHLHLHSISTAFKHITACFCDEFLRNLRSPRVQSSCQLTHRSAEGRQQNPSQPATSPFGHHVVFPCSSFGKLKVIPTNLCGSLHTVLAGTSTKVFPVQYVLRCYKSFSFTLTLKDLQRILLLFI